MPARSKSQQRLFGMVRAYQKGEFHGPKSLRSRLSRLSRSISEEDAGHFAKTPHDGLPEKKSSADRTSTVCSGPKLRLSSCTKTAQAYLRPDQANELAALLASYSPTAGSMTRSARRRSFLSRIVPGIAVGAVVGGLGVGGLGAYLARRAGAMAGLSNGDMSDSIRDAAVRTGLWGAGHGALIGGSVGAGLGMLDKIRGQ